VLRRGWDKPLSSFTKRMPAGEIYACIVASFVVAFYSAVFPDGWGKGINTQQALDGWWYGYTWCFRFLHWMGFTYTYTTRKWIGLVGLGWTGLDWTGLEWTGLDWMGRIGSDDYFYGEAKHYSYYLLPMKQTALSLSAQSWFGFEV